MLRMAVAVRVAVAVAVAPMRAVLRACGQGGVGVLGKQGVGQALQHDHGHHCKAHHAAAKVGVGPGKALAEGV